jgi:hypothetical protein
VRISRVDISTVKCLKDTYVLPYLLLEEISYLASALDLIFIKDQEKKNDACLIHVLQAIICLLSEM